MGHHFVPQFYLKGFEASGRIWAYDKLESRCFPTQAKSIANETGMYSEDIESFLATKIEDPAKPAITKVRVRERLSEEDRLALAKYVVTLWKRVPRGRERALSKMPEVADQVHANLREELDQLEISKPELKERIDGLRQQAEQIIARHKQNPAPELWYQGLQSETGPQIVETMLSMHWVFLWSGSQQFLTSDNPVFFFEHEGIGSPSSELTLPLSSSLALWATRSPRTTGGHLNATPNAVREINRRTAHNSERFLYAQKNEPWIMPFLRKKQWALSRLY
ncbi:MAG: DUF4238 domain-containing protein [Hylemonella sp.]|nr:DUF4238 domain-containing protein [Hylemonella sp.]